MALDTPHVSQAVDWATQFAPHVGGMKLGMEFFNANGTNGVRQVVESCPNTGIFLDIKLHDIPNTVAGGIASVTPLNLGMVNVHALGGATMMERAVQSATDTAKSHNIPCPMVIGVTILTSMDTTDLSAIGLTDTPADCVVRLAQLAQDSGLDGVVCSAHEISAIRRACGDDFKLIVPGIRPTGSATGDQKRTMTPRDAVNAGADYLVIGRPITQSPNPADTLAQIVDELS